MDMYEKAIEEVKEYEDMYRNIFNDDDCTFAILQLPLESHNKYISYRNLLSSPDVNDYNLVYAGVYNPDKGEDFILYGFDEIAKIIRKRFNSKHKNSTYYGTSISVSDVILIKYKKLRFAFYVDKDGFERIDGFDKV